MIGCKISPHSLGRWKEFEELERVPVLRKPHDTML